MIGILIGTSILAGMGFGWYGHKAKLRIDVWGGNENACDRIFQVAEGTEAFDDDWHRTPSAKPPLAPFATSQMRPGSAGLK